MNEHWPTSTVFTRVRDITAVEIVIAVGIDGHLQYRNAKISAENLAMRSRGGGGWEGGEWGEKRKKKENNTRHSDVH